MGYENWRSEPPWNSWTINPMILWVMISLSTCSTYDTCYTYSLCTHMLSQTIHTHVHYRHYFSELQQLSNMLIGTCTSRLLHPLKRYHRPSAHLIQSATEWLTIELHERPIVSLSLAVHCVGMHNYYFTDHMKRKHLLMYMLHCIRSFNSRWLSCKHRVTYVPCMRNNWSLALYACRSSSCLSTHSLGMYASN